MCAYAAVEAAFWIAKSASRSAGVASRIVTPPGSRQRRAVPCPRGARATRRRLSRPSRSEWPDRARALRVTESPPPTTVCASAAATASATAFVPAAKPGHRTRSPSARSRRPSSPQQSVPRTLLSRARCRARASRREHHRRRPRGLRVLLERGGRDDVGGELGVQVGVLLVTADLLRHLAADEQRVGSLGEGAQDTDLVLDLGAADGSRRTAARATPSSEPSSSSSRRSRSPAYAEQELWPPHSRGVGAVGRAEGVADVEVAVRGERARARDRSSSRWPEPRVPRARGSARPAGAPAGASSTGRSDRAGSSPFGRPRCEHRTSSATPRSRSSSSVGSAARSWCRRRPARLRAHVEVDPDEDAPALDVGVANRARKPH